MKKQKHLLKNCIVFLLLSGLLLSLAGCGKKEEEVPETDEPSGTALWQPLADKQALDSVFTLTYSPDQTVNPYSSGSITNRILTGLLYETLFTVAPDYTFSPTRLIREYESTDGGLNWRFVVNTSVQFSDGSFLNAKDVASSIRCAMQSDQYRPRLSNFSVIMGISAMDDETIYITLYEPNLLFPALLTVPVIPAGNYSVPCPIGSGLYKMEGAEFWNGTEEDEAAPDEEAPDAPGKEEIVPRLVLNYRNPGARKASLEEIYLRPKANMEATINDFEDGLTDLIENDPTGLAAIGYSSSNEVRSYVVPSMYYIGFNMGHAFVQVPQYRYAISYLIDRKTIVNKLMSGDGKAATSPVCPTCAWYDSSIDSVVHYAPQSALDILSRSACDDYDEDGKLEYMVTGIPMEISLDFLVCSSNTLKVSIARRIAADLQSVGITVNVREEPWDVYQYALMCGEFDMYLAETMLTADFNLRPLLTENGLLNYGGVKDTGYAERISAYLSSDESNRAAACSAMCQYIVANSPIIPIAFETRDVITHRGVISGVEISPYNIFYNIADWKVSLPDPEDLPE